MAGKRASRCEVRDSLMASRDESEKSGIACLNMLVDTFREFLVAINAMMAMCGLEESDLQLEECML